MINILKLIHKYHKYRLTRTQKTYYKIIEKINLRGIWKHSNKKIFNYKIFKTKENNWIYMD